MAKRKKRIKPVITEERIINKIYLIRGKKIMLGKDLAEMYDVENQSAKSGCQKKCGPVPEGFYFPIDKKRA